MAIFGKRLVSTVVALAASVSATPAQTGPEKEPTIWLRRETQASGKSWLGGLPSLPSGVEWPRHGVTGAPLHFLAQIDLSQLPQTPLKPGGPSLPRTGLLLFFADMEEEMLWGFDDRGTEHDATRVLYVPAGASPAAPPADLPEINHPFGKPKGSYSSGITTYPQAYVRAYVIDSYPDQGVYFQSGAERDVDALVIESIERATGEAVPRLQQTSDSTLSAAVSEYAFGDGKGRVDIQIIRHQMLGAAHSVQGTADAMREKGMVSLFQFDSDFGVHREFMFCDMGMAQFWIKAEDLKSLRFEKAFGTTEGG